MDSYRNYRSSRSPVGARTSWENQQAYTDRYLYSSVSPIAGKKLSSLMGLGAMDGSTMKAYLKAMKAAYLGKHIVLIWDNAPVIGYGHFKRWNRLRSFLSRPIRLNSNLPNGSSGN